MRHHVSPAALCLSVVGVLLSAQQPPAAPQAPADQPRVTFKLEVNYVEVDAIVTDSAGNFVRGLQKEDFQVLEDGKPQVVTAFSQVDIPTLRPERLLFASRTIDPDVRTNERSFDGRVYVILLDDLHTNPLRSQQVKLAVRRFIEQHFGANDLAAVVYSSGRTDAAQEFTNSQARLLSAVDKFVGRKLRSRALERLEDEQVRGQFEASIPRGLDAGREALRANQARDMLTTVKNIAEVMTGIRGRRKAMLLVSEGVDYDIYQPFAQNTVGGTTSNDAGVVFNATRDAMVAATRANVAIYAVDPRGLTGFGDELIDIQAPSQIPGGIGPTTLLEELRLSQDSLRTLAEQTGGQAFVNSNDFTAVFNQVVRDNTSYYVMGYYPANERRDGRFRTIEVKVTRPGLQVRSRRGYFAPARSTTAPALTDTGAKTSLELREALSNPLPMSGLTMSATAVPFRGEGGNASVLVAVQIRGADLTFAPQKGLFANKLEVSIIAIDQQGKFRGGDQHSLDMTLKPETYERVQEGGFRVLSRVNLPPGRYQVRVAGHESGGGRLGSVYTELVVPDFAKEPFVMSGIVIASAAETQRTLTARPDPVLNDVLPGPPATDRVFAPGEEVAVYVDVYDNVRTPAHRVDIQTTVRAEDGRTVFQAAEERDSSELQGRRGGYSHVVRVPLTGFAPGPYLLEVQASSRMGKEAAATRELIFHVAAPAP
jgi:VWFA-related protein